MVEGEENEVNDKRELSITIELPRREDSDF